MKPSTPSARRSVRSPLPRPPAPAALLLASLCLAGTGPAAQDAAEPERVDGGAGGAEHYLNDYDFSTDWFTRHVPVWERHLARFVGQPDVQYLEIGLYEGRSAIWILENVLTHPTSHLTGVDVFAQKELKDTWLANLELSGQADRATTLQMYSYAAMRQLPLGSFDIVYVDGSHDAPDVLADAVLAWGLLKPDGVLIFDDYEHKRDFAEELRPKLAIDAFVTIHRNFLEVLERDYQLFLRKTGGPCPQRADCFRVGDHVYSWSTRRLFRAEDGEPVEISDEERVLIERLLVSRPFGETDYAPGEELRSDPAFEALCERFGWEF